MADFFSDLASDLASFIGSNLSFIGLLISAACFVYLVIRIVHCISQEPESLVRVNEEGDPVFLEVKGEKQLHLFLILAHLAVYAFLGSAAWTTWDDMLFSTGFLNFNWGFLFVAPVLVHVLISIKNLPEDEVGGLYFYGHALKNADSGLHYAPFMRLERAPQDIQKIWAPGKRDQIFWGDEKDPLPPGMVRPIFMNTREAKPEEEASLAAQMTVGLSYALFWRISDFLTYNAHTRTISDAEDQLRSISEAVLAEDIATRSVNGAIEGQAQINKNFDNTIRERTEGWGTQMMRANLTSINLSHELAKKMRDRAAAKFEAQDRVIDAESRATEIELLGKADGMASRARALGPLEGRAEGLKAIKKAIGSKDGDKVHERETLRDALAGGKAVYVGGRSGMADLAGMFDFVKGSQKTEGAKP